MFKERRAVNVIINTRISIKIRIKENFTIKKKKNFFVSSKYYTKIIKTKSIFRLLSFISQIKKQTYKTKQKHI